MRAHRHVVLLMDEEGPFRDAVRDLLTQEGFEVMGARHGRAGLQLLALGLCPCLILLDMRKPSVAGAEFRRALQYDARLRDIPVALLPAIPREVPLHAIELADLVAAAKAACPDRDVFRRTATRQRVHISAARPPLQRDANRRQ